jgi:hypothetical protein
MMAFTYLSPLQAWHNLFLKASIFRGALVLSIIITTIPNTIHLFIDTPFYNDIVMKINSLVFLVMTPCSLVDGYYVSGEYTHTQDERSTFLWNVGTHLPKDNSM